MFTLFLDHAHRVLLSCFTGRFTLDEIAQCDRAVMLTLGREGPVRGIIDLTDVNAVDIPEDRLRERARQPPMAAGQERIFVATSPSALAFAYSYAAIQREFGSIGLQIVGTRSEACQRLGLHHPTFEPVPLP